MAENVFSEKEISIAREILGYLNFSSGVSDPHFYELWNLLYFEIEKRENHELWKSALEILNVSLEDLAKKTDVFRDSKQAKWLLDILEEQILPGYLKFHSDLLFHQTADFLFNSFFMARLCELVLRQPELCSDGRDAEVVRNVIAQVNDFLGYRPVPVMEDEEKHEPNPHEWVAPVPLYIANAGVAQGRYREIIEKTLEIIRSTDPVLLRDAWFDPDKLTELAIDPKAFDFDHPVNRRPNYYFGTWDPHMIDENGYFRRFIIHQVTLDAILQRVETGGKSQIGEFSVYGMGPVPQSVPHDQLLFEAASVLAGTILMGSGITGDHVQAHDSSVSLASLMPIIASYRDRFYELLIQNVSEEMKPRLESEARRLFQPFGGARQDLNKRLAKRRADQLQRFHLARVFARMGYYDASVKQTRIIAVASARILCQIECLLTEGYALADKADYKAGEERLAKIEDLLRRGIACGALPDPWSLLGFGAQYSLFPSADNTIHDHRIDDLINMLVDVFDLYSRLLKEAAAKGDEESQSEISDRMSDLAGWWDQYGSTTVSGVDGFSGQEIWESATKVASALYMWQKAGNTSGDVSFWSRHVQRFHSPKAFVLLGEALLEKNDPVASMSLLMYWLSNAETIPLAENDYTFQGVAFRWMESLWEGARKTVQKGISGHKEDISGNCSELQITPEEYRRRWGLTKTFLERLDANAGIYAEVPELEVDPHLLLPHSSAPRISTMMDAVLPPPLEELRNQLIEQASDGFPSETQNFVENLLSRKHFTLLELIDEDWIREVAEQDSGFRDFASQPLTSADIPEYVDFMRKNLVRLLIKGIRESMTDEQKTEFFSDADLLCRIIQSVLIKTGLNLIERLFRRTSEDESAPSEEGTSDGERSLDPEFLRRHYLSDFISAEEWGDLQERIKDPEKDDFELPPPRIVSGELSEELSDGFDDESGSSVSEDDSDYLSDFVPDTDDTGNGNSEFADDDIYAEDDEDEEEDDIGIDPTCRAAYDNMSYKDSAEDGVDDEMMESGGGSFNSEDELAEETDRINDRLGFIFSIMKLWKYAAGKSPLLVGACCTDKETDEARELIKEWIRLAENCRSKLEELLATTGSYRIIAPKGTNESLLEYDQLHGTKELLLDRIIRTEVEVNDTILFLRAVLGEYVEYSPQEPAWVPDVTHVMSGLIHADKDAVLRHWFIMLVHLERETLLYVPTSRNGEASAVVRCRCLQQAILRLFEYAPRLGFLVETFELLRTVQKMEQNKPKGGGAITEFDRIVEAAARSIIKLIADSSQKWRVRPSAGAEYSNPEQALVTYAEKAMDVLLACWLSHSTRIRISSVEAISPPAIWEQLKSFIQRYGADLFTQQFLNFRNIRAVLHQGGDAYLRTLMKMFKNGEDLENGELLISDLTEKNYSFARAVACLEMTFESVGENYSEYVDYNSTTTHSDHGEKLYMFLDMLRVLTQYERVAWNLKPVYWAHNVLIRTGHSTAASLWEKSVAGKSTQAADETLQNYQRLSSQYGIWLPSIYERLAERFVRPLQIARLCGLVGDAVKDVQRGENTESFKKLEEMIEKLASEQSGIGFELPEWLSALQEEVIRIQDVIKLSKSDAADLNGDPAMKQFEDAFNPAPVVKPVRLTRSELERQIAWCKKNISFTEQN